MFLGFLFLLGISLIVNCFPYSISVNNKNKARVISGIISLIIGMLLQSWILSMLLGLQYGDIRIEIEDYWDNDIKDGEIYAMIFAFGVIDFCSGIGQLIYAFYEKISQRENTNISQTDNGGKSV